MWDTSKYYKHRNNTDVAIYILSMSQENDTWILQVMWFNIGPHEKQCMNIIQRIEIPNDRAAEWLVYDGR